MATPLHSVLDPHANYFTILGLDSSKHDDYSTDDIKKAFRRMSLRVHPDRCASLMSSMTQEEARQMSTAAMARLNHVHDVLSDDNQRALYVRCGHDAVSDYHTRGVVPFWFQVEHFLVRLAWPMRAREREGAATFVSFVVVSAVVMLIASLTATEEGTGAGFALAPRGRYAVPVVSYITAPDGGRISVRYYTQSGDSLGSSTDDEAPPQVRRSYIAALDVHCRNHLAVVEAQKLRCAFGQRNKHCAGGSMGRSPMTKVCRRVGLLTSNRSTAPALFNQTHFRSLYAHLTDVGGGNKTMAMPRAR